jgi:hypothetical protein
MGWFFFCELSFMIMPGEKNSHHFIWVLYQQNLSQSIKNYSYGGNGALPGVERTGIHLPVLTRE